MNMNPERAAQLIYETCRELSALVGDIMPAWHESPPDIQIAFKHAAERFASSVGRTENLGLLSSELQQKGWKSGIYSGEDKISVFASPSPSIGVLILFTAGCAVVREVDRI